MKRKLISGLREKILSLVEMVDRRVDRLKLAIKLRYKLLGPVHVLPYRGHGTRRAVRITGRVLEEKEMPLPSMDDSAWRNMRSMLRRFLSAEVPRARVMVRMNGCERMVIADDEGFFRAFMEPSEPPSGERSWHGVELELVWPMAREQKTTLVLGEALLPREDASFGVISDIDDTIVRTGATSALTTLRLVLFSNAHTRLPFEGVGAFYRALVTGGGGENPIFYVSTGPWNLYDLISDFLKLQDIPIGPIFFKDWAGLKDALRGRDHRHHKLEAIREILDSHPKLPFVLVGDSGQQDAEIYGEIAREHPDRVLAIYIRDVDRRPDEREHAVEEIAGRARTLGIPMLLVKDTVAAAEHAATNGLIDAEALPEIRAGRAEDARGPLF